MINISKESKERVKRDPAFLLTVLETELELVRDALENLPLDKIQRAQGEASSLRNLIKVLR